MNKLREKIGISISYLPVFISLCVLSIAIIKAKGMWSALLPISFVIDFIYNKRYIDFRISRKRIYYSIVMLFFFYSTSIILLKKIRNILIFY